MNGKQQILKRIKPFLRDYTKYINLNNESELIKSSLINNIESSCRRVASPPRHSHTDILLYVRVPLI